MKKINSDIIIAVDAMGGDFAPKEPVLGVALASLDLDVKIILVGDKNVIQPILNETKHNPKKIEIFHTDSFINNDEEPKSAIRRKPDASMALAAKLCHEGKANGMVSAGNTGAYVLSAVKHIPRIRGVSRTAIASVYPTRNMQNRKDLFCLMLDVGANIHCKSKDLVQFAIMGKNYASAAKGIENPTVALLNLGKESHKGGDVLSRTYHQLSEMETINFIGNIEGNDITKGLADVVITEGYVGNIVLKTIEGIAETVSHLGKRAFKSRLTWMLGMVMLHSGIKKVKKITDYSEYGGAPLLGFREIVIKAHGRSKAKAIYNAIKVASKTIRNNVTDNIASEIEAFTEKTG